MVYQSTLAAMMLYNELRPPDLVVDISKHLVLTSVSMDPLWLADLDCARLGLTASVGWVQSAPWGLSSSKDERATWDTASWQ